MRLSQPIPAAEGVSLTANKIYGGKDRHYMMATPQRQQMWSMEATTRYHQQRQMPQHMFHTYYIKVQFLNIIIVMLNVRYYL
jgi:predicted DNA-binding ArsR family transcriptional regulator